MRADEQRRDDTVYDRIGTDDDAMDLLAQCAGVAAEILHLVFKLSSSLHDAVVSLHLPGSMSSKYRRTRARSEGGMPSWPRSASTTCWYCP